MIDTQTMIGKREQAVLRLPADYWKVERVARFMDVTPKRVYTLIRQGRLEAVRLGPRQMRVPRASIEALLRALHAESENGGPVNSPLLLETHGDGE